MTGCCWLQLRCATAADAQRALELAARAMAGQQHALLRSEAPATDVGLVAHHRADSGAVAHVRHEWSPLGVLAVTRWHVVSGLGCPACASSTAACSG